MHNAGVTRRRCARKLALNQSVVSIRSGTDRYADLRESFAVEEPSWWPQFWLAKKYWQGGKTTSTIVMLDS
jgi:hypothetical protein